MRVGFKQMKNQLVTDVHGHKRDNYLQELGVSFPIFSIEEFENLNKLIRSDQEKKNAMVRLFIKFCTYYKINIQKL